MAYNHAYPGYNHAYPGYNSMQAGSYMANSGVAMGGVVGGGVVGGGAVVGGVGLVDQPAPVRHIEHTPYECCYIDYEQQQCWQQILVPVQRKATNYYAIEHVVDYGPREWEETIVEMVPEERITERKYYLPV